MDWIQLLNDICKTCIVPLLGVLTAYFIRFLNKHTQEITSKTDDELEKKYIKMLSDTINECVIATNQTYVNYLKSQNTFDISCQKEAFNKTYQTVKAVLSQEAIQYLSSIYGDLDAYIKQKIETSVNINKVLKNG